MLDLEPIKAREKAASPGPWVARDERTSNWFPKDGDEEIEIRHPLIGPCNSFRKMFNGGVSYDVEYSSSAVARINPEWGSDYDKSRHMANADLMANARQDIPALIAEVERLREEVKRLTECSCGLSLSSGRCRICDNDD